MEQKNIMTKNEHNAIVSKLKYAVKVMTRNFNTEKDCKNEAYAFILNEGMLDKFREFHKRTTGEDHHLMSIKYLKNVSSK